MEKFNRRKLKYLLFVSKVLGFFFHEKKYENMVSITEAKKILIIESGLIGDSVMLIPFLKVLRNNTCGAEITLVCGNQVRILLETQCLVDNFVIINTETINSPIQTVKKWKYIKAKHLEINKHEYDVAIETRGDLRYIYFMHYCLAERKVAFNYTGGECFLTDVIKPKVEIKHLVEDRMYMAKVIGCNYLENDFYPILKLTECQRIKNDSFLDKFDLRGKRIIGIHPGASREHKRWKKFGELIKKLEIKDATYLVFSGPGEDEITNEIVATGNESDKNCIKVSEKLEDYIGLIAVCDMCICNDSGAGHISAAYGIPTVSIFGPFEPDFCRPYAARNSCTISHSLYCKPCISDVCLTGTYECIDGITVEEVKHEVMSAIAEIV